VTATPVTQENSVAVELAVSGVAAEDVEAVKANSLDAVKAITPADISSATGIPESQITVLDPVVVLQTPPAAPPPTSPPPSSPPLAAGSNNTTTIIIAVVVPVGVLVLLAAAFLLWRMNAKGSAEKSKTSQRV